jgi:hypothetical protein
LTCEKIYFVTRKCSKKKKKREGMNNEGGGRIISTEKGTGRQGERHTPLENIPLRIISA